MRSTVLTLALLAAVPAGAAADELEAGALVGAPIGDWGRVVKVSIGAIAGYVRAFDSRLSGTVRAGFIDHVNNLSQDYSSWTIPAWGGLEYTFVESGAVRPFATLELGLNVTHSSVDVPGYGGASETHVDAGLNFGIGVEIGPVSIRAWQAILDLGDPSYSIEIMASASYAFPAP